MSGSEKADDLDGCKETNEREIPSPTKSPRAKRSRQENDDDSTHSSLTATIHTIAHGDAATSESDEQKGAQLHRSDAINIPSTSRERQRTPALLDDKLPVWVAGSSPAKFISLDELMRMNDSLEKMAIIHEIAVNPKFSVEDLKQGSDVYEAVKKNMHQAYWDLLANELRDKPEEFHAKQAFTLLADLKGMLTELLAGENLTNARTAINDILDMDSLRTLLGRAGGAGGAAGSNLLEVLRTVLRVLKHLCAPIRDELVEQLAAEEDLIALIRGLFDLVEKMRIDMANFALGANRNLIESYSERMEREEFEKIMQIDSEATHHTKLRLRHLLGEQQLGSDESELSAAEVRRAIISLYVDVLLEKSGDIVATKERPEFAFPETLKLDESRLCAMGEMFLQLELTAGAVIVAASVAGQEVLGRHTDFKATLKNELILILNDVTVSNRVDRLNAVALQCEKHLTQMCGNRQDGEVDTLRQQILAMAESENRIRAITRSRLLDFIRQALGRTGERLQIPPGLGVIQSEMAAFTSRFCTLAIHNWNTFGTLYGKLLEEMWKQRRPGCESASGSQSEPAKPI